MTITFEPLTGVASHASGLARLRLRAQGYTEPGVHGRARLYLRSAGTSSFSAIPDAPPAITSGVHALTLSASGTLSFHQEISGSARLRLSARGFATRPGTLGGRTYLRLGAFGHAGTAGAAYALLIPQPPEVSSYGGLWFENVRDTLATSDASQSAMILVIRSLLAVNDVPTPAAEALVAAADQLALDDSLFAVLLELMGDGLALNDQETLTFAMVARAASTLLLTGQVTSYAEALQEVRSALVLGEALREFLLMQEGDTLTLSAALTNAATYIDALLDALALDDVVSPVHTGLMLVDDQLALGDAVLTESELLQLIHDALALSVSVSLDNGQYTAWTLNTDSGGVTTYDNYPFNSFARIGGRYYGATSIGVYELAGDTDDGAPIAARLRLGMSEMGTRRLKAYSEVYVGYTGNGQLLLRVIFTDDGSGAKRAAEYRMKPRPAAGRRESRFEPGKGLQAVYFDFELENLEGADFDLSSVEFQPLVSNRRTRG